MADDSPMSLSLLNLKKLRWQAPASPWDIRLGEFTSGDPDQPPQWDGVYELVDLMGHFVVATNNSGDAASVAEYISELNNAWPKFASVLEAVDAVVKANGDKSSVEHLLAVVRDNFPD